MEEQDVEVIDFDVNDPNLAALGAYAPEVDVESVPKQLRSAPPSDGYHWAIARLANRDNKPSVYIKGTRTPDGKILGGKVVVAIDAREFDEETGQERGYFKTWYITTDVFKGQRGSQVTAVCYLAGKPCRTGDSLLIIKNHVEQIFAEAGEAGIKILVKSQWVKSVAQTVELTNPDGSGTGIFSYVQDAAGQKIYDELKGEVKIKAQAAQQGIAEDQAHVFQDRVTGEDRYVMAEIRSLEDPSLLT